MSTLLIHLDQFPKERDLIARMILAYGELEFAMMDILAAVLDDPAMAVRTLFQLRSEANRLAVFEAIASPWFAKADLGEDFSEAVNAATHCKSYRNQYAHCHWIANNGLLWFCNLEETAKTKGPKCEVKNRPITLAVIEKQMAYFEYADALLLFLDHEYRLKAGRPMRAEGSIPKPKRISPPKKDSRGEAHSHQ